MVKVIKPGQKEFHGFCKWCGCEFIYEISDLKLSATSDKVSCPTCGKDYYHNMMIQDPTIPGGMGRLQTWPPDPIPCTPDMTKTDPCAGCTWREQLLRDGVYIGDTPCTWCDKNKFNSITCTQPSFSDYTTPCVNQLDAHLANTISSSCSAGTIATIHLDDITVADQADRDHVNEKLQEVYNASGCSALNKCDTCGDTEGKNSCHNNLKCNSNKNCKGKH